MTEYNQAYMVSNPLAPCEVVEINPDNCTGCRLCIEVCRTDVLVPHPEAREVPIVLFPDECWFCGDCVAYCPEPDTIKMHVPITEKVGWKDKESGERFRLGMKNPPPPYTVPPIGWKNIKEK
ncbi:MAG: 4Fe-4S binding protein [Rhodospirillaceae bacterium]|jgi:NAD-dependent dihydropyrimidine dehydrogenase PreA subunit|nr:4Fe-4S binding protein [Rhodospirillaceae bacterium]MBT5940568.1 4Fe-4S binding protein [Rhodospirillaceae bacterium]MBT7267832.1 4Fe-4S binding protein [Rhodospirillaceae bacterium]